MQNMSTQTMIHAGAELIAFGGLFFWVHRTTSGLQSQIEERDEKIAKLEEMLGMQQQLLMKHESVFSNIIPGYMSAFQPQQPNTQTVMQPKTTQKPQQKPKPQPKPQPKPPQPKQEEDEINDIDLPGDEFDKELEDELGN